MKKIKVSIIGGSGYGGSELLRILLFHPHVEIVRVVSRKHAGEPLFAVHPNLRNVTDLKFCSEEIEATAEASDVLFFSAPHLVSMNEIPRIVGRKNVRLIVDLSGDFRLKETSLFEKFYHAKHASPQLLGNFVYGLPEFAREEIARARCVASPGCFPTGALLALMPLAKEGLLKGDVIVDSKTGSSGSGADPSAGTHHPERAADFRAYKLFEHQHEPEIVQCLRSGGENKFHLTFVAHSAPMVRGIFTTAYARLDTSAGKIEDIYRKRYGKEKFVRLVDGSPRCAVVAGTNYCDIAVAASDGRVVIMTAIDNLVKGGAGQAVQSMNIALGFDETTGLTFPGTHP